MDASDPDPIDVLTLSETIVPAMISSAGADRRRRSDRVPARELSRRHLDDESPGVRITAANFGTSAPRLLPTEVIHVTRDVPSDHYIFAGEIPWHPYFASVALAENAYCENVRVGPRAVDVEVLAHAYSWESYHSEMNHAGGARVPSQRFSSQFDLHSVAQSFDQFLPDGSRATVTLSGIDGLEGDIVYIREDLLRQYVDGRSIVWFAFGERELRPYPPTPPQWLVDTRRQRANEWQVVFTERDLSWSTNPLDVSVTPETVERSIARKAEALRADSGWSPGETEIQRGRTLLLAAFDQPHNLPLPDFARLANKSRQQIYKDIDARRLLALSVGPRKQKLPDWQLDSVKQQLTEAILRGAANVDNWTLYRALSEPLEGLAGRSPVEAVTADSIEDVANAVFNVLGVH